MERLRGANEDRAIPEGGPNGCEASGSFDPKGTKIPEGERKQAAQLAKQAGKNATGLRRGCSRMLGQTSNLAAEPKSRTGRKNRQASERSNRPGSLTLLWDPRKRRPLQASERPLRVNGPVWENSCGAL
jgi:hypothetical protein